MLWRMNLARSLEQDCRHTHRVHAHYMTISLLSSYYISLRKHKVEIAYSSLKANRYNSSSRYLAYSLTRVGAPFTAKKYLSAH